MSMARTSRLHEGGEDEIDLVVERRLLKNDPDHRHLLHLPRCPHDTIAGRTASLIDEAVDSAGTRRAGPGLDGRRVAPQRLAHELLGLCQIAKRRGSGNLRFLDQAQAKISLGLGHVLLDRVAARRFLRPEVDGAGAHGNEPCRADRRGGGDRDHDVDGGADLAGRVGIAAEAPARRGGGFRRYRRLRPPGPDLAQPGRHRVRAVDGQGAARDLGHRRWLRSEQERRRAHELDRAADQRNGAPEPAGPGLSVRDCLVFEDGRELHRRQNDGDAPVVWGGRRLCAHRVSPNLGFASGLRSSGANATAAFPAGCPACYAERPQQRNAWRAACKGTKPLALRRLSLESLRVISGVGGGTSEGHRREGGELNGSSAMIGTSSRAAIACLRALTNETRRVERKLRSGGLNDGQSEELGYYMTDLGE